MVDTFTQNYNLTKPEPGSQGWDAKLNGNLDVIDSQLAASVHKEVWALPAFKGTYVNALTFTVPGDQTATFIVNRAMRFNTVALPSTFSYQYVTGAGTYDAPSDTTTVFTNPPPPADIDDVQVSVMSDKSGVEGGYPNSLDAETLGGQTPTQLLGGATVTAAFSSVTTQVDLTLDFTGSGFSLIKCEQMMFALDGLTNPNNATMVVRDSNGSIVTPVRGAPSPSMPPAPANGFQLSVRIISNGTSISGTAIGRVLK